MAVISGQTTVTTAGTEVVLAEAGTRINGPVQIKAMAGNTGFVYVGNTGAGVVSATSGYELDAGEYITFAYVGDLSTILVDSSVNGEKVCWSALNVM